MRMFTQMRTFVARWYLFYKALLQRKNNALLQRKSHGLSCKQYITATPLLQHFSSAIHTELPWEPTMQNIHWQCYNLGKEEAEDGAGDSGNSNCNQAANAWQHSGQRLRHLHCHSRGQC